MKTATGKRTIFAAGIALALPFGLAACGDDSSDDETVDITQDNDANQDDESDLGDGLSDDQADSDDTVVDDGSDDIDDSADNGTDGGEGDAADGGSGIGDADKPSEAEVRDGIEIMLGEQLSGMGITPEQIEEAGIGPAIEDYYTCVVDGIYDDVTAETLQAIASGDQNAPVFGDDLATLSSASETCVESELEPALQ